MSEVTAVRTPAPTDEMIGAFQRAYERLVGPPPSAGAYVLPAAQSALETGRWTKMYNWNAGNLTHSAGDGYDSMHEYPGSLAFRAYDELQEGVDDMMRLLQKTGVLPFAAASDVDGYVETLAAHCYVGCRKPGYDPYPAYLKAMRSLATELGAVVPRAPSVRSGGFRWTPFFIGLVGGGAGYAIGQWILRGGR